MRESTDASARYRDNIWGLRGVASVLEQVWVVVRDKQTRDEDTAHVEDEDTVEDTANGLSDVPSRALRLRSSDRDEFHTLERERCLDEDAQHTEETTKANLIRRDQGRLCKGTWILPISEPKTIAIRSSSEVNDNTGDDKTSDQGDCRLEIRMEGPWARMRVLTYF